IVVGDLAVDPEKGLVVKFSTVSEGGKPLFFVAAASGNKDSLGVPRSLCGDVNDAVDSIRSPKSCARASYHFDPVDVFKRQVLDVPINTREERGVNTATVDEHQQLVGELVVESTRTDGPCVRVLAGNLH